MNSKFNSALNAIEQAVENGTEYREALNNRSFVRYDSSKRLLSFNDKPIASFPECGRVVLIISTLMKYHDALAFGQALVDKATDYKGYKLSFRNREVEEVLINNVLTEKFEGASVLIKLPNKDMGNYALGYGAEVVFKEGEIEYAINDMNLYKSKTLDRAV